jgi:serine/threonine protein kinase
VFVRSAVGMECIGFAEEEDAVSEETNSAPANVKPGEKIAGYRLEEQIGQGGMAVVYRAYDERLDRRVALKVLAPGLASDTAFRTRFIRESHAAAAVDHPNIIPVYDAGDSGGFLYIAMRFVSGGDVRSLLSSGQVLAPARVWNIISQVASALDAAHANDLIHRDVKPANILLDTSSKTGGSRSQSGEQTEHVYLSDFGISKQTLASHLTSTGQFVGTLDYIAPETIEGRAIDGSVDQYSLACAAYELLTGEPPFRRDLGLALINAHLSAPAPSAVSKRPDLPAAVDLVLAKAMAKFAAERYPSCVEFATDLGKAIGVVPGTPSVVPVPSPPTAIAGGDQPKHPPTQLASPVTAAEVAAGAAAAAAAGAQPLPVTPDVGQPAAAATGAPQGPSPQWPTGKPGDFNMATQYAPQPESGPHGPGGMGGQTPPPQQQPGNWQPTGQQPPQGGGYNQYPPQYQQPYQTGPVGPPYQTGPVGPPYQTGPVGPPYQTGPVGPPYQTGPVGPPIQGWQGGGYPPGGQVGPTGPNWPQQPQQPAKRSKGVMIGAVVATLVIAIAAIAVVYLFVVPHKKDNSANGGNGSSSAPANSSSGSSSSPSSSGSASAPVAPTASSEATSVNNLLSTSATSREQWDSNTLVTDVGNCVNIDSDVNQISDIAHERMSELNQADDLQTDAIPNGGTLKGELMTALQISLNIDNDYLAWAQQQQSSGCSVGTDSSYYDEATNMDSQATNDKQNFVDTWNPIAQSYNLEQFSAGQI